MFLNYRACLMITLFKIVFARNCRLQILAVWPTGLMFNLCMWRGDVWGWLGWGWMRSLSCHRLSFQLVKMSHWHYGVWCSVNVKKYRYLMYLNCVFILKIFGIIMSLTLCKISVNFSLKCLACYNKENSFKICNLFFIIIKERICTFELFYMLNIVIVIAKHKYIKTWTFLSCFSVIILFMYL